MLVSGWVAASSRADVRVVGTDLLGIGASEALYAFAGRGDFPLVLAFDGSRPGLDQLKARRADVALLVLTPEETAALDGFVSVTLAYHCVVVLVPATVPLEQVTLDQLRNIFGESGSNSLTRWGELGLKGDIAGSAIGLHVPAVGQGIAVEFFRQAVLKDLPFKSTVGRYATPAELVTRLTGDHRAMALAPVRPVDSPGLKVVRVAARVGEPAFSPTPENLHSGDYPLALPLRIVFRRESAPTLRPLLRFLLGDEFTPVLERAGVVPLPATARRQQVAALEKN